jgi:hypothetical protein
MNQDHLVSWRIDGSKDLSYERRSILSIHVPVAPVCLALAADSTTVSSRAAAAGVSVLRIQDSFDRTSQAICRSATLGLFAITAVSCDSIVESWSLYDTGHPRNGLGITLGRREYEPNGAIFVSSEMIIEPAERVAWVH